MLLIKSYSTQGGKGSECLHLLVKQTLEGKYLESIDEHWKKKVCFEWSSCCSPSNKSIETLSILQNK